MTYKILCNVGSPVDDDVKNWVEQTIANSTSENYFIYYRYHFFNVSVILEFMNIGLRKNCFMSLIYVR